ncbi:MAG TPA: hypothetical protein VHH73_06605, partial [Verrucomicrobiae bacterium]|nr:hypothetical protein [Verrucomicrobiae bacterium]
FKLKCKEKLGSRYRRRYARPQTPYQRLVNCPGLSPQSRHQLKLQHKTLNPVLLKKNIEQKLQAFFTALGILHREATIP